MTGEKIKTETNKYWKSQLDDFTSQTNDKLALITPETEKQRAINTDITTNIIERVQKYSDDRVKSKTRTLYQEMYANMEEESKQQRDGDVELWKYMQMAMSTAHDKLVKTNRIVLDNNGLIKKKLAAGDVTIDKQENQVNGLIKQLSCQTKSREA